MNHLPGHVGAVLLIWHQGEKNEIGVFRLRPFGQKFADIMDMPLREVMKILTPEEVIKRNEDIKNGSGPGAAVNTLSRMRTVFNYGKGLYPTIITSNPINVLTDVGAWTTTQPRKTMLSASTAFLSFYDAISALPVAPDPA